MFRVEQGPDTHAPAAFGQASGLTGVTQKGLGGRLAQGKREGGGPEAEELEAAGLELTQENCLKGKAEEKGSARTSWVSYPRGEPTGRGQNECPLLFCSALPRSSWGARQAGDAAPLEEDGSCHKAGLEEALRCQPRWNKGDPAAGMGPSGGKAARSGGPGREWGVGWRKELGQGPGEARREGATREWGT